MPQGAVAWWSLDETDGNLVHDRIGGHEGSFCDGLISAPGVVRSSVRFNGATSCITVPDSEDWTLGHRDFTIELWANIDTFGGGVGEPGNIFIGCDEGPRYRNKWFFAHGGGVLYFHINGAGTQFLAQVPYNPPPGTWHHLAVVRQGNLFSIFVDAQLARSETCDIDIPDPAAPLTIGQAEQIGFVHGRLDEIAIYARALTLEELQSIYEAGGAGKCVATTITPLQGGNGGRTTVQIDGVGIAAGTTVRLTAEGVPDMLPQYAQVSTEGDRIEAAFDLSGAPTGPRDVVLMSPSGVVTTLPDRFMIVEGGAPDLWTEIVGLGLNRVGLPQTVYVFYGNRGNTDADLIAMNVTGIPLDAQVEVLGPLSHLEIVDTDDVDWAMLPVSVAGATDRSAPFLLVSVPAGFEGVVPIRITTASPSGFTLRSSVTSLFPRSRSGGYECATGIVRAVLNCAGIANVESCVLELAGIVLTTIEGLRDNQRLHNPVSFTVLSAEIIWDQFGSATRCIGGGSVKLKDLFPRFSVFLNAFLCGYGIGEALPSCVEYLVSLDFSSLVIENVASFDPNDKVGPQGVAAAGYVGLRDRLNYIIACENSPDAHAPVQELFIRDFIDPGVFDPSTVELGPVELGDVRFIPAPRSATFAARAMRATGLAPPFDVIEVRLVVSYNPGNATLTWRAVAIDPATGQTPLHPLAGFLPPDVSPPEGQGSVCLSVRLRDGIATGTPIANTAEIVFDANAPLLTNTWNNTLDSLPPVSRVLELPAVERDPTFQVQWQGEDAESGAETFSIRVAVDGGTPQLWLPSTRSTSALFAGARGRRYSFFSSAMDAAGNVEMPRVLADADTIVRCAADFNVDGYLDFFDYADFVTCFEGFGCPSSDSLPADINEDGFVDFFDYSDFVTEFEAGC